MGRDHSRWHREGKSKEEAAGTRRESGNKATAEREIQQKGRTMTGREGKKKEPARYSKGRADQKEHEMELQALMSRKE